MSLENLKQHTADIEKQTQELIEQAYQRGYNDGYEEGKGQTWSEEVKKYEIEPDKKREYIEQGRNEAWEAAKKIVLIPDEGGLSAKVVHEIFDINYRADALLKFSASEAIEKIRAYEERKKQEAEEIKVGDEVLNKWGTKGIVIEIAPQFNGAIIYSVLWRNAERKCWDKSDWEDNHIWKKTGRHFPEIAEVLKKMQEDE